MTINRPPSPEDLRPKQKMILRIIDEELTTADFPSDEPRDKRRDDLNELVEMGVLEVDKYASKHQRHLYTLTPIGRRLCRMMKNDGVES